jgi:hypothetical protein
LPKYQRVLSEWADRLLVLRADEVDYHGDSGIVEPRGNVRIQTQTPAQGCAALGLESGADDCVADASEAKPPETQWNQTLVRKVSAEATASE